MPLDNEARAAAVRTAKETVKAYARAELGLELGDVPRDEAFLLVLASLIVKLQRSP